jgi:hypothetical protein
MMPLIHPRGKAPPGSCPTSQRPRPPPPPPPPGLGFSELFPVQWSVWEQLAGGRSAAHDLCVAAPTGSGKTLAYSLPVVNALARWA